MLATQGAVHGCRTILVATGDVGSVFKQPVNNFVVSGLRRVTERCPMAVVEGVNVRAEFQEFEEQGLGSTGGGSDVQRPRVPFLRLGYIAFFVQEEFRDVPVPELQRDAERAFAVDEFVDVRAGADMFSDRLEVSRRDRGMQRELRAGASALISEEFSDGFVVVLQGYVERGLVHFGGGVDVGASLKDGGDDVLVPSFRRDMQGSPVVGQSDCLFWGGAQYLRYLGDVGGLDGMAEFLGVDHSAEA